MRAIAGSNVWVDQLFPVQPGQTYRQRSAASAAGVEQPLEGSHSGVFAGRGPEDSAQNDAEAPEGKQVGSSRLPNFGEGVLRRARSSLSWFYCCKSGTFGARSNAGGTTFPAVVNGNSMRTRAANIATELSLHSPPCSQIISFGTRTIQQGTRALPV